MCTVKEKCKHLFLTVCSSFERHTNQPACSDTSLRCSPPKSIQLRPFNAFNWGPNTTDSTERGNLSRPLLRLAKPCWTCDAGHPAFCLWSRPQVLNKRLKRWDAKRKYESCDTKSGRRKCCTLKWSASVTVFFYWGYVKYTVQTVNTPPPPGSCPAFLIGFRSTKSSFLEIFFMAFWKIFKLQQVPQEKVD